MTNLYAARHTGFGNLILGDIEVQSGGITTTLPPIEPEESFTDKLKRLAREIHAANVEAGWWTDLHTGECIRATRNRPEMLMLCVSELSEASEGVNRPDDKLPHIEMFKVELADTAIRLLDTIGSEEIEVEFDEESCVRAEAYRYSHVDANLMSIVNRISEAMEHYRKGRRVDYVEVLAEAVVMLFDLAAAYRFDLFQVIAEKREVNRNRLDHKPENRRADGGKAF